MKWLTFLLLLPALVTRAQSDNMEKTPPEVQCSISVDSCVDMDKMRVSGEEKMHAKYPITIQIINRSEKDLWFEAAGFVWISELHELNGSKVKTIQEVFRIPSFHSDSDYFFVPRGSSGTFHLSVSSLWQYLVQPNKSYMARVRYRVIKKKRFHSPKGSSLFTDEIVLPWFQISTCKTGAAR